MNTDMHRAPSTGHPDDDAFDRAMRQRHAQALQSVPAGTAGALRAARRSALQPHTAAAFGGGLRWAGGLAAVGAMAIGLWSLRDATPAGSVSPVAATAPANADPDAFDPATALAALDENPDLYLWLAVNDDLAPTLEPR